MSVMKRIACLSAVVLVSGAFGAGFGLYEMDARSTAMGGHVTAKPFNASAVYYNPGAMHSLTGTWVTVGGTFLKPPLDIKVDGRACRRMDPGWFAFPTFFVTQELPWGFHVGFGAFADFGIGSHYHQSWPLNYDSQCSTFEGITFQPVLSYDITEHWSIGAGPRFSYFEVETSMIRDFRTFPDMIVQTPFGPYNAAGTVRSMGRNKLRLRADNQEDIGIGLAVGTSYRFNDDISIGAMYRSRIRTTLKGDATWKGGVGHHSNDIEDDVQLPAQVQLGFNWDRAFWIDKLHFGASGSWIEWSKMTHLKFDVYNPQSQVLEEQMLDFRWRNAYRGGFGFAYDVTDNWQVLLGYVYDWDPTRNRVGLTHTMLPPGDRHIASLGVCWTSPDRKWEIALTYASIMMESKTARFRDQWYTYNREVHECHFHNAYIHCISLGITYHF